MGRTFSGCLLVSFRSAAQVCAAALCLAASVTVVGCGSGTQGAAAQSAPALPVPSDLTMREAALVDFGTLALQASASADPERLLISDAALSEVVEPTAVDRYAAVRVGLNRRLELDPANFEPLNHASLAGVCAQGARMEPAGSPLGLTVDAWVIDRLLVVSDAGGRRAASWVEGIFVFTPEGFRAITVSGLEVPRWQHSDIELAECDMRAGSF